jgi:hypothetical protein
MAKWNYRGKQQLGAVAALTARLKGGVREQR